MLMSYGQKKENTILLLSLKPYGLKKRGCNVAIVIKALRAIKK